MQFFGGSEISPSPPPPTASGNNAHMLYVFNRNGVCLLYREWNRPLKTLNPQQDHKLMFGLLFSLKSLTAKMDPTRSLLLFSIAQIRYFDLTNVFCIIGMKRIINYTMVEWIYIICITDLIHLVWDWGIVHWLDCSLNPWSPLPNSHLLGKIFVLGLIIKM